MANYTRSPGPLYSMAAIFKRRHFQDDAAKWWMDSKIIFIDFEEPSIEERGGVGGV